MRAIDADHLKKAFADMADACKRIGQFGKEKFIRNDLCEMVDYEETVSTDPGKAKWSSFDGVIFCDNCGMEAPRCKRLDDSQDNAVAVYPFQLTRLCPFCGFAMSNGDNTYVEEGALQ